MAKTQNAFYPILNPKRTALSARRAACVCGMDEAKQAVCQQWMYQRRYETILLSTHKNVFLSFIRLKFHSLAFVTFVELALMLSLSLSLSVFVFVKRYIENSRDFFLFCRSICFFVCCSCCWEKMFQIESNSERNQFDFEHEWWKEVY